MNANLGILRQFSENGFTGAFKVIMACQSNGKTSSVFRIFIDFSSDGIVSGNLISLCHTFFESACVCSLVFSNLLRANCGRSVQCGR